MYYQIHIGYVLGEMIDVWCKILGSNRLVSTRVSKYTSPPFYLTELSPCSNLYIKRDVKVSTTMKSIFSFK